MAEIDDLSFETDDVIAAKDAEDKIFESSNAVVSFVSERFKRAEDAREGDEERWLRAYTETIEVYMDQMYNSLKRKSLVYLLKSPRLKHLAAYGQIIDVLFGNNKFPLSVDPTVLPDGVSESVHINIDPTAEAGIDVLNKYF